MNELFLQLCGTVAGAIEALKPLIKGTFGLSDEDTKSPIYQFAIRGLAILFGIVLAAVSQCNIVPADLPVVVPPLVGFILTGILIALGSDVTHRVLELIKAISGFAQLRASTQVTTMQKSTTSLTATSTPADVRG